MNDEKRDSKKNTAFNYLKIQILKNCNKKTYFLNIKKFQYAIFKSEYKTVIFLIV